MSNLTTEQFIIIFFVTSFVAHVFAVFFVSWTATVTQQFQQRKFNVDLERFDEVLGRIADKAERMKLITDHDKTEV